VAKVAGNETSQGSGSAVSRRVALKRGVVAGGALLWITPAIQVVSLSSATAQQTSGGGGPTTTMAAPSTTTSTTTAAPSTTTTTATAAPARRGISFVAFRFTCGGQSYFAKQNIGGSCEGPNRGEDCGVDDSNAANGCGLFRLGSQIRNDEGELVGVTVTLTCSGTITQGSAKSGKQCVSASLNGGSATFVGALK
jgi:hypothetical protein